MIEQKLTLCLLTCQRLDLFTKTINSFLENCQDLDLIESIILVDDGSSLEDVGKTRELILKFNKPNLIFCKEPHEKGHIQSLNILYDWIKTDYIVMLEDDWEFKRAGSFIRESFEIMGEDHAIKQVLLRTTDIMAINQKIRQTKENKIDYIKYDYPGQFARDIKNRPAWPNVNLNPAIWNFRTFKNIGKFPERESNFEFNWSRKCWKEGIRVAYYPLNWCEHIGENNSAYILNKTLK